MLNQKLPSINGLRALSIILVIVHHLSFQNHIFQNFEIPFIVKPFFDFIQDGHLGVNVFFVISGFLITSLLLTEEENTKTISLKKFYIRRTLRIFPAYYFLLLVYFVLQLIGSVHITNASWLTAITYTKYFNWEDDWVTAHAWSLSIEEQFYLFWPFVFIAGNKFRKSAALALILLVPVIRVYLHYHPVERLNELTIFYRIDAIAIGCVFALYKEQLLNLLSRNWKAVFYLSVISLFSLRYLPVLTKNSFLDFIWIPLGLTNGTIADILIACIMMYSAFGPQGLWFKLLNTKVLNYIGVLSYSIYLWQQIFISGTYSWYDSFPLNLVFIIVCALASYYLIERPFLKIKTRFEIK